jgi:hypothetical protein
LPTLASTKRLLLKLKNMIWMQNWSDGRRYPVEEMGQEGFLLLTHNLGL